MRLIQKIRATLGGSIQAKLAALFLAGSLLPLLLFAGFLTYSVHRVIAGKEMLTVTDKLQSVNDSLSRTFSDLERAMTSILSYEPLIALLGETPRPPSLEWYYQGRDIENIMRSLAANLAEDCSFTILTASGGVYSPDARLNRYETFDGALAERVRAGGWRTSLFERECSDYLRTPVVTVGKTVKLQGELSALLIADIPREEIDRMFRLLDPGVSVYIFDSGGDGSPFYTRTGSLAATPPLLAALGGAQSGGEITLSGVPYLCVRSDVQTLQAVSLIPLRDVYHDSTRNLLLGAVVFLVVAVETGLFLRFVSKHFSREIRVLSGAVSAFADGQGREPITLTPPSRDELGQLTEGVCVMSRRIVAMLDTIKRDERFKRQLELRSLQSQINPHMIYNTLNTITYLAQMQGVDNIAEVSGAFGQMLRILSKTEGEFLTIRQELDYIQSYVAIKKYHLVCNVRLTCSVDPGLEDAPILKLLLQPFVENALIHGFSQPAADAALEIAIREECGYLCVRLTDNGSGMDEHTRLAVLSGRRASGGTYRSVGVCNTVERLRLQYEGDFYFHITSAPGKGCAVDIHYPLPGGELADA